MADPDLDRMVHKHIEQLVNEVEERRLLGRDLADRAV